MNIIQKTKDLKEFCNKIKKEPYITIDLEFLREKTYFAQICLIQVGSDVECAIIDPLAQGIDLSAFFELMKDKKITKVFHSCRQDIEILYNLSGFVPAPIFDTQIAAEVAGFGESVSYESLVIAICKQELNKAHRFSNWQKRPLDKAQLEYALSDVTHLRDIYKFLNKNPNIKLLEERFKDLSKETEYAPQPHEVYKKIRHRSHNAKFLTILRELAAWREMRAIKKDLPRKNIMQDEMLLNIAAACPKNLEALSQIRNIRQDVINGKLGQEILQTIENALKIPEKNYVKVEKTHKAKKGATALLELLKLLLKIKSQQMGITPKFIATEEDLVDFANFNDKNVSFLKGWQKDAFGQYAKGIRAGEIKIAYNPNSKEIEIS